MTTLTLISPCPANLPRPARLRALNWLQS